MSALGDDNIVSVLIRAYDDPCTGREMHEYSPKCNFMLAGFDENLYLGWTSSTVCLISAAVLRGIIHNKCTLILPDQAHDYIFRELEVDVNNHDHHILDRRLLLELHRRRS